MIRKLTRITICTLTCMLLILSLSTSLYAEQYTHFTAFGDSLTDHNGLNQFVPEAPEAFTNCQATPCVWVEYMLAELEIELENLDNNAIGGAMTQGHSDEEIQAAIDAGALPPLGLVGQVDTYLSQSPEFNPDDTLFTIWIGGNDLLEFFRGESSAAAPEALVQGAMANIETAVTDLIDAGALNFLVLNLPDLSQTPAFNQQPEDTRNNINELVQGFNRALSVTLEGVEYQNSGVSIISIDVFTFMNGLIAQGIFNNTTGTYLEFDAEGNPTGNVNGDADDFLFYDPIHPTTRAHAIIGDEAAAAVEASEGARDFDDDDTCFIQTVAAY
ncbi:MAG TPA: SGNH/GDSL hydrolase family protein [Desulfosalsimonadaceae bacterium]|nr:SGNH/GDSL hydrolase family protein [Desulfosalsimonadaceae bacterium]